MNIQFRIHGINAGARLPWLEQQLGKLQSLIPITSAQVMLEHRRGAAPAYETHVHLAVPGPDIHAAARDYRLEAALLKVLKNLKRQIERRKIRPQLRVKTQRHHSLATGQRA